VPSHIGTMTNNCNMLRVSNLTDYLTIFTVNKDTAHIELLFDRKISINTERESIRSLLMGMNRALGICLYI